MPEPADFASANRPTWCPGCGNHSMFEALKSALAQMGWEKHEFTMFWGIGCHGNGADFYDVQGFHGLHGRSLPPQNLGLETRRNVDYERVERRIHGSIHVLNAK